MPSFQVLSRCGSRPSSCAGSVSSGRCKSEVLEYRVGFLVAVVVAGGLCVWHFSPDANSSRGAQRGLTLHRAESQSGLRYFASPLMSDVIAA